MWDDTLGVGDGALCEVRNGQNDLLFVGKATKLAGGVLTLEESTGGLPPPVIYNTEVKLVVHAAGHDASVLGGRVCGSTRTLWRVGSLRRFQSAENRTAYRQKINAVGRVVPLDGGHDASALRRAADSPFSAPCQLIDISMGGALLSCRKGFERGDYLALLGVSLLPEETPLSFVCQVCRVDESSPAAFRYGCEFIGLTEREQNHLCGIIFTLQRKELPARRRGL